MSKRTNDDMHLRQRLAERRHSIMMHLDAMLTEIETCDPAPHPATPPTHDTSEADNLARSHGFADAEHAFWVSDGWRFGGY